MLIRGVVKFSARNCPGINFRKVGNYGSGKSSCYCLLSRAFDFLRKRAALRGSIASNRLCHGPHNFEPRRNTSGNLSALPETSATTCFKGGKTNSPEELNTFLRSDGLRKMSQQLHTLLADAIVRFRLILETMLWRSYDSLVKTARSRVRLHSFYAQKPVQIHQTYFPPSSLFGARIIRARANTSGSRDYLHTSKSHSAAPGMHAYSARELREKNAQGYVCFAAIYFAFSFVVVKPIQSKQVEISLASYVPYDVLPIVHMKTL